ncbi:MAG: YfiR family protein [Verrucomicrobia bacterium]|nr:YfiR family protein [Verrucomicrobiota bacterium]
MMNTPGGFLGRVGAGRWLACLLLVLAGLLPGPAVARPLSREYDVKAAFLYNFAMFIDWPKEAFAGPDSPFVIGVLGTDPFGSSLEETVAGERVKGRPIVIRRFSEAAGAQGCHLVFISASEHRRVKELLRVLRRPTLVTVADMPGFVEAGGLIGFVTDTRVGIRINAAALRESKVLISSKLLRLAQVAGMETSPP